MTHKSLLVAASLAVVALTTSSTFASTPNRRANTDDALQAKPVPSSIVNPTRLPLAYAGATVDIEFALDANGRPQDIRVLHVTDNALKRQLVAAFRQWRFETSANVPANSKRFILPIELKPEV